jgi:hypothetical protein
MDSGGRKSLPTRDSMQSGARESPATYLAVRTLYSDARESQDGRDVMNSGYQPPDPSAANPGRRESPGGGSRYAARRRRDSRGRFEPRWIKACGDSKGAARGDSRERRRAETHMRGAGGLQGAAALGHGWRR